MIPQLLNWNILSKPRTDFENIDHKIRKKYFFISGIWSSKAFAKYSFADFEILAIPKKKNTRLEYIWHVILDNFLSQKPYMSLISGTVRIIEILENAPRQILTKSGRIWR